jgi:hypothetical protein
MKNDLDSRKYIYSRPSFTCTTGQVTVFMPFKPNKSLFQFSFPVSHSTIHPRLFRRYIQISSERSAHSKMGSVKSPATKILVLGGSYGGLSTAVNLLRLCRGTTDSTENIPGALMSPELNVEIKIVDERDGYCEFHCEEISAFNSAQVKKL